MRHSDDRPPADVADITQMLHDERPAPTALESDDMRRRAIRQYNKSAAKGGVRMRASRRTLAVVLAVGILGTGGGAFFAAAKGPGTGKGLGHGGYPPPPGKCHSHTIPHC
jgi:hypothetical protein